MRSLKLIIVQLLKPEVLQYGTSGLSFQIVRLLSNQTGFGSGWHSLLEPFLPNLFLVHHVWRTAITKNKDTANVGCIFIVLKGDVVILYLNSWGMNRSEYWRQLLHRWPRGLSWNMYFSPSLSMRSMSRLFAGNSQSSLPHAIQ